METILNSEEEQKSILNFIANCNDFLKGKYLFANRKIAQIAEDIEVSAPLLNLFIQCIDGFDKSLEMAKAFIKSPSPTKQGYFVAPEELDKFIALAYCVFNDVRKNEIDFDSFLNNYFPADAKFNSVQKFAHLIIEPVRNIIAKYFELPFDNNVKYEIINSLKPEEEIDEQSEEEPEFEQEFNYNFVNSLIIEIISLIKFTKKIQPEIRKDALNILNQTIIACDNKDNQLIYALVMGFKYIQPKIKHTEGLTKKLLKEFENFDFDTY